MNVIFWILSSRSINPFNVGGVNAFNKIFIQKCIKSSTVYGVLPVKLPA